MDRRRRLCMREEGLALVFTLCVLSALSILGTSIVYYTTANSSAATYSASGQVAYAGAEAGIGRGLATLYGAQWPLDPNLFQPPPPPLRVETATVTYGGSLANGIWTITATAAVRNAAGTGTVKRRVSRTVTVYGINPNSTLVAWNRIFNDDPASCLTLENITAPAPLATRGDLCLLGTAKVSASVAVGGSARLDKHAWIGQNGAPVARADIANGCSWNNRPYRSPCGGNEHVVATASGASPQDLVKPTVDFAWWYERAAPGPRHPCTKTTGTPPRFDDNGIYDGTVATQNIAPPGASYTCEVRDDAGQLIGELSWDHASHALRIKGTIFIDGNVALTGAAQTINYHGQATLYVSGTFENQGQTVCAGGSGNCKNSDMAQWDPHTNILVLIAGGTTLGGYDVQVHKTSGAFQGAIYAVHDCRIGDTSYSSAPLICNRVVVDKTASLFEWPPLTALLDGQLYGSPLTAAQYKLVLGPQDG